MTKRKAKEPVNSLAGWTEIIMKQPEVIDKFFDAQQKKELDIKEHQTACAELFHKLWGEAHDSPEYNKDSWKKMQILLDKLGIPV
jgi:hypothetical protein